MPVTFDEKPITLSSDTSSMEDVENGSGGVSRTPGASSSSASAASSFAGGGGGAVGGGGGGDEEETFYITVENPDGELETVQVSAGDQVREKAKPNKLGGNLLIPS